MQQPLDDRGVHGRTAARDAAHRRDELAAVEHPVLEEVADRSRAVREQFTGVQLLHVLREDQDGQAGDAAAGLQRDLDALVGEAGR